MAQTYRASTADERQTDDRPLKGHEESDCHPILPLVFVFDPYFDLFNSSRLHGSGDPGEVGDQNIDPGPNEARCIDALPNPLWREDGSFGRVEHYPASS